MLVYWYENPSEYVNENTPRTQENQQKESATQTTISLVKLLRMLRLMWFQSFELNDCCIYSEDGFLPLPFCIIHFALKELSYLPLWFSQEANQMNYLKKN